MEMQVIRVYCIGDDLVKFFSINDDILMKQLMVKLLHYFQDRFILLLLNDLNLRFIFLF